tara:strand:- start:1672 stop:2256 length:585 start_codon:yes stop_codon:yes gene_type:complete
VRPLLPTLLVLLGTASCQSIPVEVHARALSPDFSTPIAAGQSFLAAVACNDARAEYLCFSETLKEEYGATLDGWILARESLQKEIGNDFKHAHRLQPEPPSSISDTEENIVWWQYKGKRLLGLTMEAQIFFDVLQSGSQETGSFLDFPLSSFVAIKEDRLSLELKNSSIRGLKANQLERFVLGTEWKITSFRIP